MALPTQSGSKALRAPKQEQFCHFIVSGLSTAEAHIKAGYSPDAGNARTLRLNDAVATRIAYLQGLVADKVATTNAAVAVRIAYSKEAAAADADRIIALALKHKKKDLHVALAAVIFKSRLNNLLVEQKKITVRRLADMDEQELTELLNEGMVAPDEGKAPRGHLN